MDKINIKNLEVFAHHGVFEEEKRDGQLFFISCSLYVDISSAAKTDDLNKTVNYGSICHDITNFMQENTFDLIETVAQKLTAKLLMDNPIVRKVWFEIKKPSAPIGLPIETVSIEVERSRHVAYLGMGSNLGDRKEHLKFALDELSKVEEVRILKVSDFITTAPYGYEEQGDFLNGCLKIETILSPIELLDLLQGIENDAGRIREVRWGPRTLDLDIEMYDDEVIFTDRLIVPHVEMHKRDFVLKPLCEIEPKLVHPIYKKTVEDLLSMLSEHKI